MSFLTDHPVPCPEKLKIKTVSIPRTGGCPQKPCFWRWWQWIIVNDVGDLKLVTIRGQQIVDAGDPISMLVTFWNDGALRLCNKIVHASPTSMSPPRWIPDRNSFEIFRKNDGFFEIYLPSKKKTDCQNAQLDSSVILWMVKSSYKKSCIILSKMFFPNRGVLNLDGL